MLQSCLAGISFSYVPEPDYKWLPSDGQSESPPKSSDFSPAPFHLVPQEYPPKFIFSDMKMFACTTDENSFEVGSFYSQAQ